MAATDLLDLLPDYYLEYKPKGPVYFRPDVEIEAA